MKTYEIINQLRQINTMREEVNEETGEFVYSDKQVEEAENKINATKEEKLNAIQDYKLSLNDEITRFKDKKAKQDANIKRVEKQQAYLKELQCDLLGGEKLKTDEYNFFFKTTKFVNITDETKLDSKYISLEPKIDKKSIGKDLKEGKEVLGSELLENKSLSVR